MKGISALCTRFCNSSEKLKLSQKNIFKVEPASELWGLYAKVYSDLFIKKPGKS